MFSFRMTDLTIPKTKLEFENCSLIIYFISHQDYIFFLYEKS